MKKMLSIFSMVLLVVSFASAGWEFSETVFDFANGDSMMTHQYGDISGDGYYSRDPHGIVVDANGNFWIAFYGTMGDEFMSGEDTAFYRPLRCFDADGNLVHEITVFDLPGGGTDTLWSGSDHSGTGRGIAMDNNGDILYSSYATLYRFDYETGECTGAFPTSASITDAGQASDGTIYVGHVGSGNPVHMLDSDFNVIGNAIDTVKHLARSLMVADGPDGGYDLYIGSTWSIDGIAKYHSDDPEFDSFVPTDTLGLDWSYVDTSGVTQTEGTWASCTDWTLDGDIIWGAIRKSWGGYWGSSWYIVDPVTGEQIQQFGIAVDDEYGDDPKGYHLDGGVNGPRGACQTDENTLYTVDFYLNSVDKWTWSENAIEDVEENVLKAFKLEQNYPNPFNPTTKIAYQLENAANVNLTVYNMLGAEVATLVNSDMAAGRHIVDFNASDLSTGVYFCKLVADGKMQTIKMLYMK